MLSPESGRLPIASLRVHVDLTLAPWRALLEDMRGALRARRALALKIVCPKEQRREVRRILGDAYSSDRVELFGYSPSEGPIHNWACDDGKWFSSPRGLLIASGKSWRHAHYPVQIRNTQLLLARALGIDLLGVDFAFDCGDVVAGERHVLVGEWTLSRNRRGGASRATVLRRLSELLGRRVLPIETQSVHGFRIHVDSQVCLIWSPRTRRETAFVNDPRLTLSLLTGRSVASLRSRRAFEDVTRAVFDGKAVNRSIAGFRAFFSEPDVASSWASAGLADRLAAMLRRNGYAVKFLPSFLGWAKPVFPDPRSDRTLAMLTYTNLVVDRGVILLSDFGTSVLDRHAARAMRGYGYRIVPMRSATQSWRLLGGPHCLSNAVRD